MLQAHNPYCQFMRKYILAWVIKITNKYKNIENGEHLMVIFLLIRKSEKFEGLPEPWNWSVYVDFVYWYCRILFRSSMVVRNCMHTWTRIHTYTYISFLYCNILSQMWNINYERFLSIFQNTSDLFHEINPNNLQEISSSVPLIFYVANLYLPLTLADGNFCEILSFKNVCIKLYSKHTTLFQGPSDVHNVQMTLNRRQNDVLY